jgi:hypothetical protein
VHQGSESLTGSLVSLDSAGLVIATGKSDTVTAPRASITAVEVSVGTKSHAGTGALIGLGVGAATGVILGLVSASADEGDFVDVSTGAWTAGVGLAGAAIGAGVGAIIGATQRSDKWQPAALPTFSVQRYGPNDRRVAIGLRMTF